MEGGTGSPAPGPARRPGPLAGRPADPRASSKTALTACIAAVAGDMARPLRPPLSDVGMGVEGPPDAPTAAWGG